jgi:hypothetical protein
LQSNAPAGIDAAPIANQQTANAATRDEYFVVISPLFKKSHCLGITPCARNQYQSRPSEHIHPDRIAASEPIARPQ